MHNREDYIQIIQEIRNVEKISLDEYIENRLMPLQASDKYFLRTLYKDVHYILKDLDAPGDNDLMIENGDFAQEDGDYKLSGYQTRLHDLSIWLHMEAVKSLIDESEFPNQWMTKIENFQSNFLDKHYYTPEYKSKLDSIKKSLHVERFTNTGNKKGWIKKILDVDNLELKPNIAGIGINLNEIINKFRNKS